ncbi:MAG: agmatinase family protein [Cytobacillus gottheilii]|uniref:agmatinase family protein n=1 Tax=Cytobacillus gottheilii TaxID=859144 RepID=UPI003463CDA2
MTNLYEHIQKSSTVWIREQGKDMKVKDWIIPAWEEDRQDWDAVILGVPLSRSSISPSAASEFPKAFRSAWELFTTYYFDEQVDFRGLKVADLGDVRMHSTDILQCHKNIVAAMKSIQHHFPNSFYTSIGGDHSITAPIVRSLNLENPDKSIGIVQLDTHLDLRDLSQGPTNGTPIRQLVEDNIVKGENIYNIGLHGFYNAPSLIEAAQKHKVNMISLKQLRKQGISVLLQDVMEQLQKKVDIVYLTVDMDVLDISYAPGVPASTPGGMRTDELFDLLFELGKYPIIRGMDFVCIDPQRDNKVLSTVKATTYAVLTALVSRYIHINTN